VKLLKLLTAPAVLLMWAVMAVPASAHHVTQVTLSQTCDTTTGRICLELKGQIQPDTDVRIVTLDLLGKKGSAAPAKVGEVTLTVPENHGSAPVAFDVTKCFDVVSGSFDSFSIVWVKVTDSAGAPADLTIALANGLTFTQDQLPATLVSGVQPCTAATPTPTPTATATATPGAGAGTPTPTATAANTAALAQTGGFDFRLPLIGLTVIVAGLALFLVSASRGRRSTNGK
jgi:hypothetical protein